MDDSSAVYNTQANILESGYMNEQVTPQMNSGINKNRRVSSNRRYSSKVNFEPQYKNQVYPSQNRDLQPKQKYADVNLIAQAPQFQTNRQHPNGNQHPLNQMVADKRRILERDRKRSGYDIYANNGDTNYDRTPDSVDELPDYDYSRRRGGGGR